MINQRSIPPAGEISFETELVTTAAQNPIQFPRYRVGQGLQVEIWPRPGNVGNIFISPIPNQANTAGGIKKTIPNNAAVAIYYRVENLSELWLGSVNVGDGVTVRLLRGSGYATLLVPVSQSQSGSPSSSPSSAPSSAPSGAPSGGSSGGTSSGSGTPSGSTSGRTGQALR